MRHILRLSILCLALAVLTACTSDEFTISMRVKGLGNQNVRLVYLADDALTDTIVPCHSDRLDYVGHSSQLTVITIVDPHEKVLAQAAVVNGDNIDIDGDLSGAKPLRVRGNDATEQWNAFRNDHAALYAGNDQDKLDAAIEEFIAKNRKSVTATLLLMCDYTHQWDTARSDSLLQTIDASARPTSLLRSYSAMTLAMENHSSRIAAVTLLADGGNFETFSPLTHTSVILFWLSTDKRRADYVEAMRRLGERNDKRLQIVDISLDADTATWHRTVRADSTEWLHYWAPGGVTDIALVSLHIQRLPLLIVSDSVGSIQYRGNDTTQMRIAVDRLVKK